MNTECINSSAVPSVSSHPCASRAQQHTQALCPRCSLGFSTWEGCSWISPVNPESLTTFTKNIWHKLEYLKGTSPGRQVSFSCYFTMAFVRSLSWTACAQGQKPLLGSLILSGVQHKRCLVHSCSTSEEIHSSWSSFRTGHSTCAVSGKGDASRYKNEAFRQMSFDEPSLEQFGDWYLNIVSQGWGATSQCPALVTMSLLALLSYGRFF